ncbi:MAG: hypothetical protein ACO1N1_09290 [Dyadobacter fermentans]
MEKVALTKIISPYKPEDWISWITDILYYGIAKPYNTLTPDGDVLVDTLRFLNNNGIDSRKYEQALIEVLSSLYAAEKSSSKIQRVLEVLVIAKSPQSKRILMRILFDYNRRRDSYDSFTHSKIFQALLHLELTNDEKDEINLYVENVLVNQFHANLAMMGNYLRYILKHSTTSEFFQVITQTIRILDSRIDQQNLIQAAVTIEDKFRELYFEKEFLFYNFLFTWITKNHQDLGRNRIYIEIIKRLANYLNKRYETYRNKGFSKGEIELSWVTISVLNLLTDKKYIESLSINEIELIAGKLAISEADSVICGIAYFNKTFIGNRFACLDNYEIDSFSELQCVFNGEYLKTELHMYAIQMFIVSKSIVEHDPEYINLTKNFLHSLDEL